MNNVFSDECVYNILGQLKKCWNYTYPTGSTLETAIFRGIKPFYPSAKHKGSPSTLTDVGKESQAFDIKGSNKLGHLKKLNKRANKVENNFYEQTLPSGKSIIVKVPKSIETMVRRPSVDINNFKSDPEEIITGQIDGYKKFAFETTKDDGYSEIYSIVCIYGQDHGFKSVFLSIEPFETPQCASYVVGQSTSKKTKLLEDSSYQGLDTNGDVLFSLSGFNAGSSNFYKRFNTTQGILMTWEDVTNEQIVFSKEMLQSHSSVQNVNPK